MTKGRNLSQIFNGILKFLQGSIFPKFPMCHLISCFRYPGSLFVDFVLLIFLVFCVVFLICLSSLYYVLCSMLPVSLDWALLIDPSMFSNVYVISW